MSRYILVKLNTFQLKITNILSSNIGKSSIFEGENRQSCPAGQPSVLRVPRGRRPCPAGARPAGAPEAEDTMLETSTER